MHFAGLMERLSGRSSQELFLTAALLSSATREGNICLDLTHPEPLSREGEGMADLLSMDRRAWLRKVRRSRVVGRPGHDKPIIVDRKGRVYLNRYWAYQDKLAAWVRSRVEEDGRREEPSVLRERLERLFPGGGKEVDWQKVCAFAASMKTFTVITGGPGTGKTTTAAKVLALLMEEAWPTNLRIALASPTGKGAARLQEAINHARGTLACREELKATFPGVASTLHRLLGPIGGSPYFRRHAGNPLDLDVLVVDEASMVDLALMSKLVDALGPHGRLILLGDKDQLASVEAGAVLGDICDTGRVRGYSKTFRSRLEEVTGTRLRQETTRKNVPAIADCIVQLQRSYRFSADSGISVLSHAVNEGQGEESVRLLREGCSKGIRWKDLPPLREFGRALKEKVVEWGRNFSSIAPQEVYRGLGHFRILCALRQGPFGAPAVNLLVEWILRNEGFIRGGKTWYPGRPVLVTRNDYELGLFNGDTGITLADASANHDLRVFFPAQEGTMRAIHPVRMPEHETVYAMTVHKSQGSEFDRVLLLLPDRDSPVLSRELIYTAVTRARESVEIWGREEVFRAAVTRRIERNSGLRDALWGN
ncbi:MAG: exodeoxyribonuclease V subunit alpha [Deltaproteobacteria bacterium]|nr:exodeoxyribonuclease V subunit alpha [Deltaproteobacteria bacterium]